jgi:hypothetical protein
MPIQAWSAGDTPQQILLADGSKATEAQLNNVAMQSVECTEGGQAAAGDASKTHIKVELMGLDLKEKRYDAAAGSYSDRKVKVAKQKDDIAVLTVEIGGATYDLLTTEGKLQFIFAKSAAALPLQALISLRYKSPLGGQWFLDRQPIDLKLRPRMRSRGCALM